jgi:hypothetical protein
MLFHSPPNKQLENELSREAKRQGCTKELILKATDSVTEGPQCFAIKIHNIVREPNMSFVHDYSIDWLTGELKKSPNY